VHTCPLDQYAPLSGLKGYHANSQVIHVRAGQIVKSTALPSGRTPAAMGYLSVLVLRSGQRLRCASGAETRNSPELKEGAKIMVVTGTPLAPRLAARDAKSQGRPTAKRNLLSLPSAKNPIHCPSGERTGIRPRRYQGSVASKLFSTK